MKQTILIMILFLFSNNIMLPLFSCLSCFDIPLQPFISLIRFESGFTVVGESEGSLWYPRGDVLRSAVVFSAAGSSRSALLPHTEVLSENVKVHV